MPLVDVRHQSRAQRLIQRALWFGRWPHAAIFTGGDGVGKEMLAERLARVLLCTQVRDTPPPVELADVGWADHVRDACGTCQSCHLAAAGNHPDLHLIYRQLNAHHPDKAVRGRKALDLGIDVVRHFVIDAVGVRPALGERKVFIIREADRITNGAQNALLKTLEEPPADTYLILVAGSVDRLLPTTRSRCQVLHFAPLPQAFIERLLNEHLEDLGPDASRFYAVLSQGSAGRALALATEGWTTINAELTADLPALTAPRARKLAVRIMEIAKERSAARRQADPDLSDTAAQRAVLQQVMLLLGSWFRDCLVASVGSSAPRANDPGPGSWAALAAADAIEQIARTEWRLGTNAHAQLCIEALMLQLAALAAGRPLAA